MATEKNIEEIVSIKSSLFSLAYDDDTMSFPAFTSYFTGIRDCLGCSMTTNTLHAGDQLLFALALCKHPMIHKITSHPIRNPASFPVHFLLENNVLRGLKILDMGCGNEPTFARCARRFGAVVYTVDTLSAESFLFEERYFSREDRRIEKEYHVECDLVSHDAIEQITKFSRGEFDLATEAHLTSTGCFDGFRIGISVLTAGGVYYTTDTGVPIIKH